MTTSNLKLQTSLSRKTPERIFLIGMMGAGKSTKGKKIAHLLGFSFIDLDEEIEKYLDKNIAKIFEEDGEEYFRKTESLVLQLMKNEKVVIATGGGTPCYYNNMQYIKNSGISIYLRTKSGMILQRISRNPEKRPSLKGLNNAEMKVFIEEKIAEREPFYLQSDLVFDIPETTVKTIVKSVLSIQI